MTAAAYGNFSGWRWRRMKMLNDNGTRELTTDEDGEERDRVANKDGIPHLLVAIIPK
jgi:hypothetical protein